MQIVWSRALLMRWIMMLSRIINILVSPGAHTTLKWYCSTLYCTQYNLMSIALERFCWTLLLIMVSEVELSVLSSVVPGWCPIHKVLCV
jgi:hypothetical protein